MPASQASAPQSSYCHSTESSSVEPTFYPSFDNFGTIFEASWPTKAFIRSTSVKWGWDCQSCRSQTQRPKNSSQRNSCITAGRISMENCTTRDYHLYLMSFKQSLSVNNMTTLWQDISASIKPWNLSAVNTIGWASKKILRPMSKAVTYA